MPYMATAIAALDSLKTCLAVFQMIMIILHHGPGKPTMFCMNYSGGQTTYDSISDPGRPIMSNINSPPRPLMLRPLL